LPFVVLTTLPSSRTIALHRADGQRRRIRCDNVFSTNTAIACRAATLAGGGFGWLTEFSVCDDVAAGNLVRLLPEWQTEPAAIQAIFPSASHTSSKVAAVIGALRKQLTGVE
jgi:DNA-binding transcriptional LysR family regulator